MNERVATTAEGTIAWVSANAREAEATAARLRGAGFADVRLSESGGTTSEPHVAESEGLTSSDFAAHLQRAGFAHDDATALTAAIARGGVLVTLAAGALAADALAVMRGEAVTPRSVRPVDVAAAVPVDLAATSRADVSAAPRADVSAAPRAAEFAPASTPLSTSTLLDRDAAMQSREVASAGEPAAAGATCEVSAMAPERPSSVATPDGTSSHRVADVIPLREERLEVTTERERGEARIRKEVVTEQRTVTVPVRREQLVVERDGEPTVRIPLSDDESTP